MADIAIEVCNIWKKFHRGQLHDSLRDLIPSLVKQIAGRGVKRDELGRGDFWALKDVAFELHRGEALGIIGANGAGKSTLLKILSRILRPNAGSYRVHGQLRALIDLSAGFHDDLTGRENIYLSGAIVGMPRHTTERKFDEIVAFSGIEPFIDTPVKRYSSGMRARLGFSVMAHMEPEILLVDEVLSVGDVAFRAKCVNHMRNLIRSDVSIIFISHNLDQIRHLCDRCLVLENGAVRYIGDVQHACHEFLASLHHSDTMRVEHASGECGRLGSLAVLDENGVATFKIQSHRTITIELSYVLTTDIDRVGVEVNFYKPDGTFICSCNSVEDDELLPNVKGRHTITITIPGLPFSDGDYWVGHRLLDISGNRIIDDQDRKYCLLVSGTGKSPNTIYLNHAWVHNGGYGGAENA